MKKLRKIFYFLQQIFILYKNHNYLKFSFNIGNFYAVAKIKGTKIYVPIRSIKILRRLNNFSKSSTDIVFTWLTNLKNCKTFYDIGSANGLEGFYINGRHNSKVVFFESYIPSLEDLLKGVYLKERINNNKNNNKNNDNSNFNIVQAACGENSEFTKIYSHSPPKSGYTFNTHEIDERDNHLWKNNKIQTSNWVFVTTIDDVQKNLKIDPPTHIKIDVDGYENKVLKGATNTLKKRIVEEWMIEIHKKNSKEIYELMNKYGYIEKSKYKHYSDANSCWDSLFVKI